MTAACISETVAICRYFEEVSPEPRLFGGTPVEKANARHVDPADRVHPDDACG